MWNFRKLLFSIPPPHWESQDPRVPPSWSWKPHPPHHPRHRRGPPEPLSNVRLTKAHTFPSFLDVNNCFWVSPHFSSPPPPSPSSDALPPHPWALDSKNHPGWRESVINVDRFVVGFKFFKYVACWLSSTWFKIISFSSSGSSSALITSCDKSVTHHHQILLQ